MSHASVQAVLTLDDKQHSSALRRAESGLVGFGRRAGSIIQKYRVHIAAASTALVGLAAHWMKLAAEQDTAVSQMEAALASNGQSVEAWSGKLQAAATAIQSVTVYGDEMLMGVMSLAANMGVSAGEIDGATRAAIGLSKAFGIDLNSAMKMIVLAGQGEFGMLQRYVPQLRQATTASEKLAIVNKVAAAGFQQAQAETQTAAGQMAQLKNVVGDLGEELGAGLLPAMQDFVGLAKGMVRFLSGLNEAFGGNIGRLVLFTGALGGVAVIIGPVVKGILAVVSALKALAMSQAVVQAMSGPAGWAALAAGAAIAAAAIYGIDQAFGKMAHGAETARGAAAAAVKAAAGQPAAADGVAPLTDDKVDPKRRLGEIRQETEALQREINDLNREFREVFGRSVATRLQGPEGLDFSGPLTEQEKKFVELNRRAIELQREQQQIEMDMLRDADAKHRSAVEQVKQLELQAKLIGKSADEQRRLRLEAEGFEPMDVARINAAAAEVERRTQEDARRQELERRQKEATEALTSRIAAGKDAMRSMLLDMMFSGGKQGGESKGKSGFTAQWEDVGSHYKRIQAAAASRGAEDPVKKAVDAGTIVQKGIKTGVDVMAKGIDAMSIGIANLVKRGFRAVAG